MFLPTGSGPGGRPVPAAVDVAEQARAHGVQAAVPLMVTPGSEQVRATIERDGQMASLKAIGATVLANACGPCIGQWRRSQDVAAVPNTIVTSYNRNFPMRNDGQATTMNFIGSPEIVTAVALSGRLSFNPLTSGVQVGDAVTDGGGAVQAGSFVVSMTATSITLNLATTATTPGDAITITSYNEWHEGTQIEAAVPHCDYLGICSLDYDGAYGTPAGSAPIRPASARRRSARASPAPCSPTTCCSPPIASSQPSFGAG